MINRSSKKLTEEIVCEIRALYKDNKDNSTTIEELAKKSFGTYENKSDRNCW